MEPTSSSGSAIKLTSTGNSDLDPSNQSHFDEAGASLSAVCNPDVRKHQLSGAASIIRAIRGKRAAVVSSESWSPLAIRGPYDVVNLATTWGLDHMRARDSIGRIAHAVIKAAQLRRTSYRQVIMLSNKRKMVDVNDIAGVVEIDKPNSTVSEEGPEAMDMSDAEQPGLKRRKFV